VNALSVYGFRFEMRERGETNGRREEKASMTRRFFS
jgi:hypothetical protein